MAVKYGKNNPRPQSVIQANMQKSFEAKLGKLPFKVVNPGTLSRSASNALRGKSAGASGAAGKQVAIARTNQRLYNQEITPEQYAKQMGIAVAKYDQQIQVQADQRRRTSVTNATSLGIKENESRAVASKQGVAIGTINDGAASTSKNSSVSNNVKVSEITKPPTQTTKQNNNSITKQAITVTSPDGEIRTFKDEKTADTFIERTKTNYQKGSSYIGYGKEGQPIQGAPENPGTLYSVSLTEGGKKQQSVIAPAGTLEYVNSKPPTVLDNKRYDNLGQAALAGFGNALRYSDAVDRKEAPKPEGLEFLNYYASKGLRSFYNVPISLSSDERLIQTMVPTFIDTVFDTGLNLVTKGKTETHDPVGDYIKKDPFGTLVQLPSEAALWIVGAKAVSLGTGLVKKGVTRYSPLKYEALKFPIDNKMKNVYRGLTINDDPIIGIQNGKIVKGFDETKLPFDKIDPDKFGRYGWEPTQSSGIASKTIFAEKSLDNMVAKKIITILDKERIATFQDLYKITKGTKSKTGSFSINPIDGLTQNQSNFLLTFAKTGQKAKKVDSLHGSTALQPQIDESLRKIAGSHLKLGDLDLVPKAKKAKNLPKVASELIQGLKDFPLEKGQSIKIIDDVLNLKKNKELVLMEKGKKDKKILEVILEERNASGTDNMIRMGSKVLDETLSTKTTKTKDFGLNIHSKRFQLQENMRTALGFHKGTDGTLFNVFASEGRSKDIVRSYWNFKDDAIRIGGKKGAIVDKKAEHLRSLYESKTFKFDDVGNNKSLLLSSSKSTTKGLLDDKINIPFSNNIGKDLGVKNNNPVDSDLNIFNTKSSIPKLASRKLSTKSATSAIISKPSNKSVNFLLGKISSISSKSGRSIRKKSSIDLNFNSSKSDKSSKSGKSTIIKFPSIISSSKPSSKSPIIDFPSLKINSSSSTKSPSIKISELPPGKPSGRFGGKLTFDTITKHKPGKKIILPIITWGGVQKVERKIRPKDRKVFEFIGNSSDVTLSKLFKRKEVTYGVKTIKRLETKDWDLFSGKRKYKKNYNNAKKKAEKRRKGFLDVELNF